MKIYLASSWRNKYYGTVLRYLRNNNHEVYDFKQHAFSWSDIGKDYMLWSVDDYMNALQHPKAVEHFNQDKQALDNCDVYILLLPCGRSAHLEAGYAAGQGKPVYILIYDYDTPELMNLLLGPISTNIRELLLILSTIEVK